jgi:RNA polymerase-binding transcription factor DksA
VRRSLERKSSDVTKSGAGAQSAKATKPAGAAAPAKTPASPAKAAASTAGAKGATARASEVPAKATKAAGVAAPKAAGSKAGVTAPGASGGPKSASAKATESHGSGDNRAGLSAKLLEKLRRRLEDERSKELQQAEGLLAEAEALAVEREHGDTQFDEESGEGDTLSVERERDLALSASARQSVEEIERALARMDGGHYGLCERCTKRIAPARLEALPQAALCIECASRLVRRR